MYFFYRKCDLKSLIILVVMVWTRKRHWQFQNFHSHAKQLVMAIGLEEFSCPANWKAHTVEWERSQLLSVTMCYVLCVTLRQWNISPGTSCTILKYWQTWYFNNLFSVHHQCHSSTPGKVLVCGEGDVGQLGLGEDVMEKGRPGLVNIPDPVIQVCGGGMHTVCLTEKGEVSVAYHNISNVIVQSYPM